MNPNRPFAVTFVCFLAMLFALIDAVFFFTDLSEGNNAQWMTDHINSARLQLVLHYAHSGITLLACYFILKARNWARWLYVIVTGVRHTLGFVLLADDSLREGLRFLCFKGAMVPGLLIFVFAVSFALFRRNANEYFAAADRPWWEREKES
jgi:hypothetical protein